MDPLKKKKPSWTFDSFGSVINKIKKRKETERQCVVDIDPASYYRQCETTTAETLWRAVIQSGAFRTAFLSDDWCRDRTI